MTDLQAFKWILNKFNDMPKNFSNSSKWMKLEEVINKYKTAYKDSAYIELLERYQRALYELASIDYFISKGGDINCTKTNTNNT